MSMLLDQLLNMESHNSFFESAIRLLPIPVCAVFGDIAEPKPAVFASGGHVLATRDGDRVAASFPNSVEASGNAVLVSSGINRNPPKGRRVAIRASGLR